MIKQIHTLCLYDYLNVNPLARMCVQSWEKFGNGAEIKIWTENDAFIHDKMQNSIFCQNIIHNPNMCESQKKIEVCDYLKNCIMFEFGGLFIDAATELLSEVDFSSSFYLNYPSTSALCVPFYIDHVNDSIFSDVIAKYDNIMPYIHLPLQSGSDGILNIKSFIVCSIIDLRPLAPVLRSSALAAIAVSASSSNVSSTSF